MINEIHKKISHFFKKWLKEMIYQAEILLLHELYYILVVIVVIL